jgi:hypothetical protein
MAQEKKAPGKLALLAFVPWLLYIFATGGNHWRVATGGGAILCLLYLLIISRRSTIKLMDWATLAYFVTATIIIVGLRSSAFPVYHVIVIWSFFAVAAWTSIALGKPFTVAYAREEQPFPEIWEFPVFKRITLLMAVFWGALFSVNVGFAVLAVIIGGNFGKLVPGFLVPTAILIFGFIFNSRFPPRYVARFNARAFTAGGSTVAQ